MTFLWSSGIGKNGSHGSGISHSEKTLSNRQNTGCLHHSGPRKGLLRFPRPSMRPYKILRRTRRSILGSDGMMKSDCSFALWVLFKCSLSAFWVPSECLLSAFWVLWVIGESSWSHPEGPEVILKSSWSHHEIIMMKMMKIESLKQLSAKGTDRRTDRQRLPLLELGANKNRPTIAIKGQKAIESKTFSPCLLS